MAKLDELVVGQIWRHQWRGRIKLLDVNVYDNNKAIMLDEANAVCYVGSAFLEELLVDAKSPTLLDGF